MTSREKYILNDMVDFPGDIMDRNPPAEGGDMGSFPGPGRFHMLQSK